MANYKTVTKYIEISGITVAVPKGTTLKHLYDGVGASSTGDALFDHDTGLVYQVTAGKTFKIVGVVLTMASNAGGTLTLHQADTEDATTVLKITIRTPIQGVDSKSEHYFNKDIAGGKFITSTPSTTQINHISIVGYEY